jgi:signal transduction histidine kinase
MEQVIENLLVNALRYVPPEGTVEMSLSSANGSPHGYRLSVSDDGPGVSPEELPHVFERFYRAASARGGARGGGSGLGLAIVREIVERHGGEVTASSSRPHGLSICVDLPDERSARSSVAAAASRDGTPDPTPAGAVR